MIYLITSLIRAVWTRPGCIHIKRKPLSHWSYLSDLGDVNPIISIHKYFARISAGCGFICGSSNSKNDEADLLHTANVTACHRLQTYVSCRSICATFRLDQDVPIWEDTHGIINFVRFIDN